MPATTRSAAHPSTPAAAKTGATASPARAERPAQRGTGQAPGSQGAVKVLAHAAAAGDAAPPGGSGVGTSHPPAAVEARPAGSGSAALSASTQPEADTAPRQLRIPGATGASAEAALASAGAAGVDGASTTGFEGTLADPHFDPFRRDDTYGCMGVGPLSLWERARLALLMVTVLPLKVMGTLACLLGCYLTCKLATLVVPARWRGGVVAAAGRLYCRACLLCLGFWRVRWVKVDNEGNLRSGSAPSGAQAPALAGIVSNHCGWADILVHMAHSFPAFVARANTRDIPLVGFISELMGCIYVEREHKAAGAAGVAGELRDKMARHAAGRAGGERPMLLFPEGTTTNGRYLLPFKTGAFLAGGPLQPVILQYGRGRVSLSWDTIPAKRHLLLVLANPLHSVIALELPVYVPSRQEVADPALFAHNVRQLMLRAGGLQPSAARLPDKRRYHALLEARARGAAPPEPHAGAAHDKRA